MQLKIDTVLIRCQNKNHANVWWTHKKYLQNSRGKINEINFFDTLKEYKDPCNKNV